MEVEQLKARVMRRGHRFVGAQADRKNHIYESYRLGAERAALALAWGLTLDGLDHIIAEGNGGTSHIKALTVAQPN